MKKDERLRGYHDEQLETLPWEEKKRVMENQLRRAVLIAVEDPASNHNGGMLAFGRDDYLYLGIGDGGRGGDPWNNAQSLETLLGKMLRIDVNQPRGYSIPEDNPFSSDENARPEIWAYGLRNPWRHSFDTVTGDLWIADVGQNKWEEINIIEKGKNYGWKHREGFEKYNGVKKEKYVDGDYADPIFVYPRTKGLSVTGGYVYRGSAKAWDGKYIFGDWSKGFAAMDGQLFVASKGSDGKWSMDNAVATNMSGNMPYILAFAQDGNGEVYALTSITTGPNGSLDTIYKITPAN